MRITVDLMGAENPPSELFEGVLTASHALEKESVLEILATPSEIAHLKESSPFPPKRIIFTPVESFISMDDDPLQAVRRQKTSSMVAGVQRLSEKNADAFITAGNTGSLITSCRLYGKRLAGVKKPALVTILPTAKIPMVVLDVGGNIEVTSEDLLQFAKLGADFYRSLYRRDPTVGLLNIGIESKKGRSEYREAYEKLKKLPMKFYGNVEGKEAFQGKVDLLVTDGFTGNVFLKTTEGASAFVLESIAETCHQLEIEIPESISKAMQTRFYYEYYLGAFVSGIEGIAVKCHGSSTAKAMHHAIMGTADLYDQITLNPN